MDMHRIWLVAKREWTSRLAQRSFRIVTAVQVLVILIGACVPTIIARFSGDSVTETNLIVVDQANASVADRIAPFFAVTGDGTDVDKVVIQAFVGTPDEAREQVNDDEVDAALIATRDESGELSFQYETRSGVIDATAQRMYSAVASLSMQDRLSRDGVSEEAFTTATIPPTFSIQATEQNSGDDVDTGARYAVGFAFTILMYMAIILYGQWVAQGVVEEKSSRIMEIMINAATPRDLLAGKVLGIGLAALTQVVPMLLVGGIAFALQPRLADAIGVSGSSISGIDFGAISAQAIGTFAVFFVLGFILYASLYASIASLLTRQEEVSQAVSPLMTFTILGYLGAIFAMSSPDSLAATVLSIFPLTSPFAMVSRAIIGNPPAWQIGLSALVLALTAIAGVLFASRVYRVGVLMYGQKPSWKAVFRTGTVRAAR